MALDFKIKNLSDVDINPFKGILKDLLAFSQKRLGFDKPVEVIFISDPENAINLLGKTAHYSPLTKTVTIYVDNRHPKDMLRSVAHELVHHAQNCRGEFNSVSNTNVGYAQEDEHMREMEREAYELGNMCFRDFEDGIKTNKKKATIYIKCMQESKLMAKNTNNKNLLREGWMTPPAVDYCQGSCKSEAEASKQCGAVGVSLQEDGYYDDGDYGEVPFQRDSGGGGLLNWLSRSLRVHENDPKKIKEIVKAALEENFECEFGGPAQVVPENLAAAIKNTFQRDVTEPDPHYQKGCEGRGPGLPESKNIGKNIMKKNNFGLNSPNAKWQAFLLNERTDKRKAAWMQAFQNAAGNPQPPPQDFWDTATYLYSKGDDPVEAGKQYAANNLNEYGDHETQASGGLVASGYSSEPSMDFVEDIAKDVVAGGGSLMQIATALKDQGFDANVSSGVLMIQGTEREKFFIGKASNFDIDPNEETRQIGPYVLGFMDSSMSEAHGAEHEEAGGWGQVHGNAADEAPSREQALEAMADLDKTVKNYLASSDEYAQKDGKDLSQIRNMFAKEINGGATPGKFSQELKNAVSYLDTIIRDEIPQDLYYSLFPDMLEEGITADGKEFNIGDMVQVTGGGLMGATGEIIEFAEGKAVVRLETDANRPVFGKADDEVIVRGEDLAPMGGINEMYGEDEDYFMELEKEFPFLSKAVKAGEVPEEVAAEIAMEYGDKDEMPSDDQSQLQENEGGWFEVYDEESGKTLEIWASSPEEAEEKSEEVDYDAYRDGEAVMDTKQSNLQELESEGGSKEEQIRKIVSDKQAANVEDMTLDLYSASAIVKVLDAINDQNKEKFLAMPVDKMAEIAFKMMK